MRLNVIRSETSLTHLALIGRLDVQGVGEIQLEFLHQTTSLPKRTIVDLSAVTYIASLGISMLVSAAKELERHGAGMVLLNPAPLVRKALETTSLEHVIPIVTECKARCASGSGKRKCKRQCRSAIVGHCKHSATLACS